VHFTWCTVNTVQWSAWWWLCESKHVATVIIGNTLVVFTLNFISSDYVKHEKLIITINWVVLEHTKQKILHYEGILSVRTSFENCSSDFDDVWYRLPALQAVAGFNFDPYPSNIPLHIQHTHSPIYQNRELDSIHDTGLKYKRHQIKKHNLFSENLFL
jgi:hypothetical protein